MVALGSRDHRRASVELDNARHAGADRVAKYARPAASYGARSQRRSSTAPSRPRPATTRSSPSSIATARSSASASRPASTPAITGNTDKLVFAIDGAVAKARTGAFFANNPAPLTSRTIQFISQSTITQREVESNPNITDPNSTAPRPGLRRAGRHQGGHFPPASPITPQVDLFAHRAHQPRQHHPPRRRPASRAPPTTSPLHEPVQRRPAFVPAGQDIRADSYGDRPPRVRLDPALDHGQSRGIATLPGGIPLLRRTATLVGGIGVFFPGKTGFATEENSQPQHDLRPDEARPLAGGGVHRLRRRRRQRAGARLRRRRPAAASRALPGFDLPVRPDRPGRHHARHLRPRRHRRARRTSSQLRPANLGVGQGDANSGVDQPVDAGGDTLLAGQPRPRGLARHAARRRRHHRRRGARRSSSTASRGEQTRAAIRLPLDSTHADGLRRHRPATANILGLYRMPDATVFSIDVAVAKARNVAYYADPAQLQPHRPDPRRAAGTSRSPTARSATWPSRASREASTARRPAPFSILNDGGIDPRTGLHSRPAAAGVGVPERPGLRRLQPRHELPRPDQLANQNGIVFFPGSAAACYANGGALIGGFGVSGDGVDQDDVVTGRRHQRASNRRRSI